jgi:hypothetical protein
MRTQVGLMGLISSVPTNPKADYILTTMKVQLLAATVLLVHSGVGYFFAL